MKVMLVCLVVVAAVYGMARFVGRMPANCDDVAEQLASYELGNYAEPEDRAPVVTKPRAICKREGVSRDESACLEKTKSKLAAARCVPRLFPDVEVPDCAGAACYLSKVEQFAAQMCACLPGNRLCAEKITEGMTKWGQDLARLQSELGTPKLEAMSESDARAIGDVMRRYSDCMVKAITPVQ